MTKQTYSQNWSVYNLAQTSEKLLFLKLLNDAVDYLQIPYEYSFGRPHAPIDDMLKACVIKVFNNFSSRRTIYELQLAYALRYIRFVPHFNTINKYLGNPELTPYLHKLYKLLAMPLVSVENNFAIDATGFSNFDKRKWVEVRLDKVQKRDFRKLHIISGVKTNIITSAEISGGHSNDTLFFEKLVKQTSLNFRMREILADAGYLSRKNCGIAEEVGAVPYIFPKKNTSANAGRIPAWHKMIRLWKDNEPLFRQHYHQRSLVESTFSMMKRKFLPYVRSKSPKAQENEILAKVVCHNAAVLVSSIFELNVEVPFK